MSSTLSTETGENTCVVCFKNVSIYSIGECDHPVCYECSTRMRVLCRQNECPICRQDMPKVIFTKDIQLFKDIKNNYYLMDKKFKICFDNASVQAAYSKLLEHVCTICSGRPAFRTFQNLKDHMRKEHELHYCDLCVDNLKIFTGERRCYTRQELAQHRRKGDPDDRSHRGHPLCEFCDQRYMDNDELFRHLRRDHLFCHFCDADGFHRYYSSYDYLREHFRADHFLCEEGGCSEEKFTSAFRSEIDLKAHRASVHGRSMGKAAAKQARTLELEFTLAPRRERPKSKRSAQRLALRAGSVQEEDEPQGAVGGRNYEDSYIDTTIFHNAPNLNTNCIEEFPTLSGSNAPAGQASRPNSRQLAVNNNGLTIRTVRQSQPPLAVNDDNFPALGSDMNSGGASSGGGGSCKTVRLSVNSGGQDRPSSSVSNVIKGGTSKAPTNVSIHVNHRPNGALTTRLSSSQNIQIRPPTQDDFPSLSSSSASRMVPPVTTQWLGNQAGSGARTKTHPSGQVFKKGANVDEEFPTLTSKFNAKSDAGNNVANPVNNKNENRSKKATSVTIPVSSSWALSQGSLNGPKHQGSQAEQASAGRKLNESECFASNVANIKVRSKKKKTKNTNNNATELAPNAKSSNSQECCGGDIGKRKKKNGVLDSEEKSKQEQSSREPSMSNREDEIAMKLEGILKCNDGGGRGGTGGTMERKRSELLIASLSSEKDDDDDNPPPPPLFNSQTFDDDFPALGSLSSCPPGFSGFKLVSSPPPGFGGGGSDSSSNSSIKSPPPGFSVTLNSVARPQTNGLTFTNSSGQSYSILPGRNKSSTYRFVPPQDSFRRNQALVAKVEENVEDMDVFLQMSALFRQGDLPAHTFYQHCMNIMGPEAFSDIFPDLLVLLPDIEKQQHLLAVHTSLSNDDTSSGKAFEVCATCGQVLSPSDLRFHHGSHTLENHFSSAGSTAASTAEGTWGKK